MGLAARQALIDTHTRRHNLRAGPLPIAGPVPPEYEQQTMAAAARPGGQRALPADPCRISRSENKLVGVRWPQMHSNTNEPRRSSNQFRGRPEGRLAPTTYCVESPQLYVRAGGSAPLAAPSPRGLARLLASEQAARGRGQRGHPSLPHQSHPKQPGERRAAPWRRAAAPGSLSPQNSNAQQRMH
jgi:hypothetical protein